MVRNMFRGGSKAFFLLWHFAVPGIKGVPVKGVGFDMSQLATTLQPSRGHDLQLGGVANQFEVGRPASGGAAGPCFFEIHSVGQPQYLVGDGVRGFQHSDVQFSHSSSNDNYQTARAKVQSSKTNTSFRVRENKGIVVDGANVGNIGEFFGDGGNGFFGQALENGVHSTRPSPNAIQYSSSNAAASDGAKYITPPSQRGGMSSQPASKPAVFITAPQENIGYRAPKAKSGVVITDLSDNEIAEPQINKAPKTNSGLVITDVSEKENIPPSQTTKRTIAEKQQKTSVSAKNPTEPSLQVSSEKTKENLNGNYNGHKKTEIKKEEKKPTLASANEGKQDYSREQKNHPDNRPGASNGDGEAIQRLTLEEFKAIAKARWGVKPDELARFTEWFNENKDGKVKSWSEENQNTFDKYTLCRDFVHWQNKFDPNKSNKVVESIIKDGVDKTAHSFANQIENIHLGEIIDTMNLKEVEKRYLKDFALKAGADEKENKPGIPWKRKDVEGLYNDWKTTQKPFIFKLGLLWENFIDRLKSWLKCKKSGLKSS